jgi:hypothetical protein
MPSRAVAVGSTNKSLTYGEVIPSSMEEHVLPALGLPDDAFILAATTMQPGEGTPVYIPSPRVSTASSEDAIVFERSESNDSWSSRASNTPTKRLQSKVNISLGGSKMDVARCLKPGDVFYDLGSGTGKIPLQVALQCPGAICKGVEYAAARHVVAKAAYDKILKTSAPVLTAECKVILGKCGFSLEFAASIVSQLKDAGKRLTAVCASFLEYDLSDATVLFINNTVFEPPLMLQLLGVISRLPRLRRVLLLRSLCGRHSQRCIASEAPCAALLHPPIEGICNVSASPLSSPLLSSPLLSTPNLTPFPFAAHLV